MHNPSVLGRQVERTFMIASSRFPVPSGSSFRASSTMFTFHERPSAIAATRGAAATVFGASRERLAEITAAGSNAMTRSRHRVARAVS